MFRRAAALIRQTSRERPADAVLRDAAPRPGPRDDPAAADLAGLVFAYYRWFGWLDPAQPLPIRLREAADRDRRFRADPDAPPIDELRRHSVPAWVLTEADPPLDWFRQLQKPPVLWLRARPGTGATLATKLGLCTPAGAERGADALRYDGVENLFARPEFQTGEFEIQDLSSQAVGWLCDPQPGQTWWDACAGEGGKTMLLSDLMQNRGLIWASDRAEWRLQRLKRRAARARVFNYRTVAWDGGARRPTKTSFDGVLVDAPCTGLGTWQRNPHARWTTTLEDVRELAVRQLALLAHAAPAVKPGGRLLYAVCTLTRAETHEVAQAFTRASDAFEPLPLTDPFDPGAPPRPACFLRATPHGGNGMFVAAWRRRP